MIEVKIVKDEDGHTYIIPAELEGEFDSILVDAIMYGDYNKFIERFSMYMRNDVKLYMRED
jgi:hypothetical protein